MNNPSFLKSAILKELAQVGLCRIEVLYERLPYYSVPSGSHTSTVV